MWENFKRIVWGGVLYAWVWSFMFMFLFYFNSSDLPHFHVIIFSRATKTHFWIILMKHSDDISVSFIPHTYPDNVYHFHYASKHTRDFRCSGFLITGILESVKPRPDVQTKTQYLKPRSDTKQTEAQINNNVKQYQWEGVVVVVFLWLALPFLVTETKTHTTETTSPLITKV